MIDLTKTLRELVGRQKKGKGAVRAARIDEFLRGTNTDRLLVEDLPDPAISKALSSLAKTRAVKVRTTQHASPVYVIGEEVLVSLIAVALTAVESKEAISLSSTDRSILKILIRDRLIELARNLGISLTQDDFSVFDGDGALQKALAFSKTIHSPLKPLTKSQARRLPKID